MEKNVISVKVELNQINYSQEDLTFLTDGELKKYKVDTSLESAPSAVGWDAIHIVISIGFAAGTLISSGYLGALGTDLYKWSKNKLRKVTLNKSDFDDSNVRIELPDCNINIYANTKEDLVFIIENISDIMKKSIEENEPNNSRQEIHINVKEFRN